MEATNGLSATQKQALDPAAYDPNGDGVFTDTLSASPILNFIRGDHSNEKSNPGGTYRIRSSLLGDIINSNPVYIGDPPENFNFDNFSAFKTDQAGREKRIAMGANDGMLHVFDAANGDEVYAYIPSMLIVDPDYDPGSTTPAPPPPVSKLDKLKNIPYVHTYFVDGELTAADAEVGTTSGNWKTVLTGGLGAGAKGLFALDVTNPDASNDKVLFEKTGADIGHIYGSPTIARLANGKWYIVTGNGFGSTSGKARLLLISLEDYTVTKISACEGTSCAPVAEGLAAPTLVDTDGDSVVDFAYAGDDSGNMWRFNLHDNTVIKLYTGKIDTDGTPLQPITTAPEIGSQPNGGYMVYFGTGTIQHQWEGRPTIRRTPIHRRPSMASGTAAREPRSSTRPCMQPSRHSPTAPPARSPPPRQPISSGTWIPRIRSTICVRVRIRHNAPKPKAGGYPCLLTNRCWVRPSFAPGA